MLRRVRIWQLILCEIAAALLATALLVVFIHFPDVARRPMPPPKSLFFGLIAFLSLVVLTSAAVGVRISRTGRAVVIVLSIAVWLLGCYALLFVWINTFGT
jgi:hypothetical protein